LCLAIPGRVIDIDGNHATVEYGEGVRNRANISLVEVQVGDYVLVHAGFAIKVMDESEARKTLDVWKEMLSAEGGD
jgi:hydrogenase expression/formation protein HypC